MVMPVSMNMTDVVHVSMDAVECVMPGIFLFGEPTRSPSPIQQTELGVLIGITGDLKGRLFISSATSTFATIGRMMSGMDELDHDMVMSFAAELANMIAGNFVRLAHGLKMDISPPTTLEGGIKLYSFQSAMTIPLTSESLGTVYLSLMLEDFDSAIG